jgi:hypothetical protein
MTDIGRSRRAWRRAFFVLLGVAVVAIGGLLIAVADKKVSYAGEHAGAAAQELGALAGLLEEQSPTRATLLRDLRRRHPKERITATDSTVSIHGLTFQFAASGRLERITHSALGEIDRAR